jgi:hypothetical protein
MSTERRIAWAIFDKRDGEMSMIARWGHAKVCLDAGHEVLRVEFDRHVPDFGEGDADVQDVRKVKG